MIGFLLGSFVGAALTVVALGLVGIASDDEFTELKERDKRWRDKQ
jgi:hypothetical protein